MVTTATYAGEQAQAYPRPKTEKYTTRNTSRTRAVAQPPGRNLQYTAESEQAFFCAEHTAGMGRQTRVVLPPQDDRLAAQMQHAGQQEGGMCIACSAAATRSEGSVDSANNAA